MHINDLFVGQEYKLSKSFTYDEVLSFSKLSLDNNPIHLDEEFARGTAFHNNIVHGFLTGSLFSAIIGTKLPGHGSIYLNQNMNFRKPIYHNEVVTACVKVKEIKREKSLVYLETICFNSKDEIVIDGEALVKLI